MRSSAELDVVVYGASGFTGQLVADYLSGRVKGGAKVKWALAGRSQTKLAGVRDAIGAPADTPLITADGSDPASLMAMARRTKVVLTTVGPYQLYGSELVAACARSGTDYVDLCGEPAWMRAMIDAHHADAQNPARASFSRAASIRSRSISACCCCRRQPRRNSARPARACSAACAR